MGVAKWKRKALRLAQSIKRKGGVLPSELQGVTADYHRHRQPGGGAGGSVAASGSGSVRSDGMRKRKRGIVGTLSGVIVCVCGSQLPAGLTNKEIEREILLNGGQPTPSPAKCTHLLLCPDGVSCKKHTDAKAKGKVILTYAQFHALAQGQDLSKEQDVEGQAPMKRRKRLTSSPGAHPPIPEAETFPQPPAAMSSSAAAGEKFQFSLEDVCFRI